MINDQGRGRRNHQLKSSGLLVTIKDIEYGVYGALIITRPQPYSIYLSGTIVIGITLAPDVCRRMPSLRLFSGYWAMILPIAKIQQGISCVVQGLGAPGHPKLVKQRLKPPNTVGHEVSGV